MADDLIDRIVVRAQDRNIIRRVVARVIESAYKWDGKFIGAGARLRWTDDRWLLEELQAKGKKKLRVADMENVGGRLRGRLQASPLLAQNVLRDASLSRSDDYDAIKKKILKSMEEATEIVAKENDADWLTKSVRWNEDQVYFMEVMPEGVEPFKVEGKDFTINVEWSEFKTYSPNSDFQQADPHYTMYAQASPQAARKLYKILKADPTALKSVSWSKLSDWLAQHKINYKTHFSQWT